MGIPKNGGGNGNPGIDAPADESEPPAVAPSLGLLADAVKKEDKQKNCVKEINNAEKGLEWKYELH